MSRIPPLVLLICLLPPILLLADEDGDHQQARRLVEEGTILPLEQLLERVGTRYPGRVLEVELERKRGGYHYELEILDPSGEVWELEVDAETGELIERVRD